MPRKEADHKTGAPRLGARGVLGALRGYLGAGRARGGGRLAGVASLSGFVHSRASHVAQTALYGYLRTRAGTRYPELFENDAFLVSINIAKWQLWLACVSDLGVYAGGRLAERAERDVAGLMGAVLEGVLAPIGVPADAGLPFPAAAERVCRRFAACDFARVADDESAFTESPAALVRWAPVDDSLKALDEEIIRNSVRFRWQEVRRELRRDLDAPAVLASHE